MRQTLFAFVLAFSSLGCGRSSTEGVPVNPEAPTVQPSLVAGSPDKPVSVAAPWATLPIPTPADLYGVWGSDTSNVIIVGEEDFNQNPNGLILRFANGNLKSSEQSPLLFRAVGGVGNDVFAVGLGRGILHSTNAGEVWEAVNFDSPVFPYELDFSSVYATVSGTIYFGGLDHDGPEVYNGVIVQSTGSAEVKPKDSLPLFVQKIGGVANDLYAVGLMGYAMVSKDGGNWQDVGIETLAQGLDLFGVWGSGPNDIYVVGDQGTILHFDGQKWSSQVSGTQVRLNSVWGSGPNDIYVVGDQGTVLYHKK